MTRTATAPEGRGTDGAPRLAEGIELIGEYEGSGYKNPPYIARRADGGVIQLTHLLHLVASHSDGRSDLNEIAARVSEDFGRRVSADNVSFLVDKKLRPLGVLAAPDGSAPKTSKPDPLLALKFKTVLVPEGAVLFLARVFGPLFWPPVMLAVGAGFAALDIWYFSVHGVAQGVRSTIYQPGVILLIYGLLVASVAWHEMGHATACRYGGARPGVIGFGIYVVWPAFYTDVTDAYRLGKAGRVRTDLGGIYFNAIFALGTAGAYFLTHYEPLLIVVLIQHLLMFYQFMPFLRLDGYYVISDLTGVPDLFARIKPTLRSLVPGRRPDEAVTDLKPWVRVVVNAWVLTVLPVLLYGFLIMLITAPRVIATTYDSLLLHWDEVTRALGNGEAAGAAAGSFQMGLLVAPMGGMGVTLVRVLRRLVAAALGATEGRPLRRAAAVTVMAGVVGASIWLLLPNGEYRPIQPAERGTVGDSLAALSELTGGRPGLSEEREKKLGGAPFASRMGATPNTGDEGHLEAPAQGGEGADTEGAEPREQPDQGFTGAEESPSPDPSTEDATPTPTPDEFTTPTPEPTVSPKESPLP